LLPPSSHSVDLARPINPTYDMRPMRPVTSAPLGIEPTATAPLLARGVCRALGQLGYASLVEFPLANGRRADILGLGKAGDLVLVEIKSSVADFRADRKWANYRDFADRFYFAIPSHFPHVLIPEDCGLMVADPFGAVVLREGQTSPLSSGRRRALILRFARVGAMRLHRCIDPEAHRLDGM
jgi:hypothetical protein